jgi:hypothetical protein
MEEIEGSLDETAYRKWRIRSWSAASDWAVREAEKVGGYERVWGRWLGASGARAADWVTASFLTAVVTVQWVEVGG